MKRPEGIPEEFWHNESPEECLRTVEEMVWFYWRMGVRPDDPEYTLPPAEDNSAQSTS